MPRLNNFRKSIPTSKDEFYTPPILVETIVKYTKECSTVWCPFDTVNSEFVRCFQNAGRKVIHSHIVDGQDFFSYEPEEDYDYIISNPPFTMKKEVLLRLYDLDKPFAMIMGLPILNYQEVGEMFYELQKDLQLLIVDKKVSFDGNTSSFNNSFFCYNMLPKQIVFEHLEHNNSNQYYVGSAMEKDRERIAKKFGISKKKKVDYQKEEQGIDVLFE